MDRRVTLLLFLSLLFSGAKASVVSLSLKESEQRFSEHNLEVIAERYNIDIAEAQVVQAKLFENPVVSLEQNVYNRLNGRYFDFGKQGETIVEVEQLIYIAGQRNKRVRLEKINKEMALYQFEEVLRTLRSELKEKFIALYFTRKSQSIYDREIDSLAHLLVVLKEQNEKGNVSLLEKSRIEALLLSLRQERNDIANQVISRICLIVTSSQCIQTWLQSSGHDHSTMVHRYSLTDQLRVFSGKQHCHITSIRMPYQDEFAPIQLWFQVFKFLNCKKYIVSSSFPIRHTGLHEIAFHR